MWCKRQQTVRGGTLGERWGGCIPSHSCGTGCSIVFSKNVHLGTLGERSFCIALERFRCISTALKQRDIEVRNVCLLHNACKNGAFPQQTTSHPQYGFTVFSAFDNIMKNTVRLLFSWYATHILRTDSQGAFLG